MLRPYLFCRGNAPDLRELVRVPGVIQSSDLREFDDVDGTKSDVK